jgi:hypothetical protein
VSIYSAPVRRHADHDEKETNVQYMLLIYSSEQAWASATDEERQAMMGEYRKLAEDLRERGSFVAGDELDSASTAKTVTVQNGNRLVTDGPFAETKVMLGGYYLVEAESEDQALEWAARIPSARHGKVEVRPIQQH